MLTLHTRRTVHLSLGGNLGDRLARLSAALPALAAQGLEILRVSPVYETAPMYVANQPAFLNMAAAAATGLGPHDLLATTQAVERAMGRDRSRESRNGPRTLDIDIVMMEGETLTTPALTLPHPRMAERAFVLAPLADIAGAATPPGWTISIDTALDQAPGRGDVRRFAPPPAVAPPPTRRDDAYVISLRDFHAPAPDGGEIRMDLDLKVLHPGRQFRDDISAVMSYEDIVVGLRRLCARAAGRTAADLARQAGDLCLGFPRVLSVQACVASGSDTHTENFERASR